MCKTLTEAVAGGAAASGSAAGSQSNAEADELRAENKKLSYRVTHLLRTIEEIESAKK